MDILNNIKKTNEALEKKVTKSLSTAKLDLKKISCKNKLNAVYREIGRYIHSCKNSHSEFNSNKLETLCAEADSLKDKIKGIEKQISSIKKNTALNDSSQKKFSAETYSRLNKKENDLKLVKTEDGIKFIKLCPECSSVNPPEAVECFNCSHKFKEI